MRRLSAQPVSVLATDILSLGVAVIALLSVSGFLVGGAAQAQFGASGPDLTVTPSSPTTDDLINFNISGTWNNGCTPDFNREVFSGSRLEIFLATATGSCSQALTNYSVDVARGPFPEGTFEAIVFINGTRRTSQFVSVSQIQQSTLAFLDSVVAVDESANTVSVSVERLGSSQGDVSVEYLTVDGTARAGVDYEESGGSLTWQDGDMSPKTASVRILDDLDVESAESFQIDLLDASGAGIGSPGSVVIEIADNDNDNVDVGMEREIPTGSTAPANPKVVYSPLGGKAVVWVERSSCVDAQSRTVVCFRVLAQFYNASDLAMGQAVEISRSASSVNDEPTAAFAPDGRLFVVWPSSELAGRAATGAKFASRSSALVAENLVGRFVSPGVVDPGVSPVGPEVEITENSRGNIERPDVEIDKNGNVSVGWEDDAEANARFLNRDGSPRGRQLNPGAADTEERRPSIGTNSSGASVMVFEGSGSRDGIVARRFSDEGRALSGLIFVDRDPSASRPDVVVRDDGSFVVAWERPVGSGVDVMTRIFDEDGQPLTPARPANGNDGLRHLEPRIDLNSGADFVVVWRSTLAARGGSGDLVGRFFNPLGEPVTGEVEIAETGGGTTPVAPDVSLDDSDEATVVFERQGPNGVSEGIFRTVVQPSLARDCVAGKQALCLQQNRFEVRADWQDFAGGNGQGQTLPLTTDSGTFWFFSPDNVELIAKVLDGCGVNGHYWLFAAGLTDVEVHLKVDDTGVGGTRSYFHSGGNPFETIRDVNAFPCSANRPDVEVDTDLVERLAAEHLSELQSTWTRGSESGAIPERESVGSSAVCQTGATSLCLNQGRFRVDVDWASAQGTSGLGRASQLTGDSGTFWFFSPDNVELIFKILDGCSFNQRYWVFGSGLTDVEVNVTITDTQTGAVQTFANPLGQGFVPIRDIGAFEGCP